MHQVKTFLKGEVPYGACLAYLAMKKRAGDQEYQSPLVKFQFKVDVRYCEPSLEALTLMSRTMGKDVLELLDPIARLVAGTLASAFAVASVFAGAAVAHCNPYLALASAFAVASAIAIVYHPCCCFHLG